MDPGIPEEFFIVSPVISADNNLYLKMYIVHKFQNTDYTLYFGGRSQKR